MVRNSNVGAASLVFAAALAVQAVFEMCAPRLARWARAALLGWLGAVAVSAFGLRVATIGPLLFVSGRVLRASSVVAVRYQSAPRSMRNLPEAEIELISGASVAVAFEPQQLARMLQVPARSF